MSAGLASGDFQTLITELARPIDFTARYPALTAPDALATMSARCCPPSTSIISTTGVLGRTAHGDFGFAAVSGS